MSGDFDLVVIGGGILGTAVAEIASQSHYDVLVIRLCDETVPCADTLRNQGWLQSGMMYYRHHFADDSGFKTFARKTYYAGRGMLANAGIALPSGKGIIGTADPKRILDLEEKAKLLSLTQDQFRRLTPSEHSTLVQGYAEPGKTYFLTPDVPFDEAGVLRAYRDAGQGRTATFKQLSAPATLTRSGNDTMITADGETFKSPLTLIAAGAGSFTLLNQIGVKLDGSLRRTPLLVGQGKAGLPASVFVDLDHGVSAVHHECDQPGGAFVAGTRSRTLGAPSVTPDARKISLQEQQDFAKELPPQLKAALATGRFTAGYEVVPNKSTGLTDYQPWIQEFGDVIFASPGRATIGVMAAGEVYNIVAKRLKGGGNGKSRYQPTSAPADWTGDVSMHFTANYKFNDAE